MSKILPFIVLFHFLKANEGYENNGIFSYHAEVTSDIFLLPNRTRDASIVEFPSRTNINAIRFGKKSLLRIPLPDYNVSSLICFPKNEDDYRDVYILSHFSCRTMGFMTFASIKAKMSPFNQARIKPKYLDCSGLQRGASSCKVLPTATENCRMVTEVTCGACNGTYKGFNGVIKSPGFPFSAFDDVTCEWNVIVPERHDIMLSFNQFDAMDVESANLPCSLHKPYVHIMYGIQSKVTIDRYCQLSEVKNISIPFNTVKIIVFTGLQGRQEPRFSKEKLGISITFQAIVPAEEIFESPLKLLGFFLLAVIFIACNIFCHYVRKYKLCNYIVKGRDGLLLDRPKEHPYDLYSYNRIGVENTKLTKHSKADGANAETVNCQGNSKMVYESGKDINEYSNLFNSPTRRIPSVTRRDSHTEKLNVSLHKKLNLVHSYHGTEDPNRLSVSPTTTNYYDYPSSIASRQASSVSGMQAKKEKLKYSKSTC